MPPRESIGDMSPLGLLLFVFAVASLTFCFWRGVGYIMTGG